MVMMEGRRRDQSSVPSGITRFVKGSLIYSLKEFSLHIKSHLSPYEEQG